MNAVRPQSFVDALSYHYADQDYGAVADHYDTPGAMYLEDDVIVWSSKDKLVAVLRAHCAVNRSLGVHSAKPVVVAQSLPDRRHFTLWIDWLHLDEQRSHLFTLKVRYFCRYAQDGAPMIQLVEVPQEPRCYRETEFNAQIARCA